MTQEINNSIVDTPLMKQYMAIKAKYPDALLLFRVGDFYETFGEDAIRTSKILGIVLTRRANGAASFVELAGFPHHSLDTYLPKLVKAGCRVAICDQLEDPKLAKKIVKRGVTEVVTPGIAYSDKILDHKSNNFLASIHLGEKINGIAFVDISTGEFYLSQGSREYTDKLLQSFQPNEIVVQKNKLSRFQELFNEKAYITTFEDWVFTLDFGQDVLLKHFGTKSLKGFGVEELEYGIIAAGAILHYLAETQHNQLTHISKVTRIQEDNYIWLDKFTIRNLELFSTGREHDYCLLSEMDATISPMGARLLKRWLALPLKNRKAIDERLNVVEYFLAHDEVTEDFIKQIKMVGDLERIISKLAIGKINPREVKQLQKSLEAIDEIKKILNRCSNETLKIIAEQLNPCLSAIHKIKSEILPEPSVLLSKGNVIAEGVSAELDDLRHITRSGKEYLVDIQRRESDKTGIPSLKVAFNNVFGYYFEVTNTHKDKVPSEWIRKQTLVNAERYITEELKGYEEKILGAEDKILSLETKLFNDLITALSEYIQPIQLNASLIARIDCLIAFGVVAKRNKYCKPLIVDDYILEIRKGRHPVIENHLPTGEEYVANDVYLDNENQQILIITGPNMSGKSALLRQTALIVIMAQMGCYVPAESAKIGLVDKIFTRVGASDNLASGESTFMVEMNETASILNNIGNNSLILLDEIGRGTSTYDGISIAWSIVEYLHNHPLLRAKTLFATHYHELNELAASLSRVKNYNVAVKEVGNKVIFLRKLVPGGSEHSFGIHVARMAGIPSSVIERSEEILANLEKSHSGNEIFKNIKVTDKNKGVPAGYQLSFIQLNDPLLEQIRDEILNIDINTLTPVEALMKLNEIKKILGKNKK